MRRALIAAVCCAAVAGCAWLCGHVKTNTVTVEKMVPCLDRPPPVRTDFSAGIVDADGGCPEPWDACLTAAGASGISGRISALETWSDGAWARCHSQPDAGTSDAGR